MDLNQSQFVWGQPGPPVLNQLIMHSTQPLWLREPTTKCSQHQISKIVLKVQSEIELPGNESVLKQRPMTSPEAQTLCPQLSRLCSAVGRNRSQELIDIIQLKISGGKSSNIHLCLPRMDNSTHCLCTKLCSYMFNSSGNSSCALDNLWNTNLGATVAVLTLGEIPPWTFTGPFLDQYQFSLLWVLNQNKNECLSEELPVLEGRPTVFLVRCTSELLM